MLVLVCAISALVLILVLTSKPEPSAKGHPLSYWVAVDGGPAVITAPNQVPNQQMVEAAEPAIKQIGTNAIPFFLEWMDYERPRWKLNLLTKARKLPNWVINSGPAKWFFADTKIVRAQAAAFSFRALGPTAEPAIHELEIRAQSNSVEKRSRALFALSCIGPAAVPAIRRVLSNPNRVTDTLLEDSLVFLGTNARPLIPMFVEYLDHTNANVAVASARTLGDLRLESDVVIPALIRKLGDPRQAVRIQVPLSLANFAPPALTRLTNALSDPDPLIRQQATNALAKIASVQNPTPVRPSAYE